MSICAWLASTSMAMTVESALIALRRAASFVGPAAVTLVPLNVYGSSSSDSSSSEKSHAAEVLP